MATNGGNTVKSSFSPYTQGLLGAGINNSTLGTQSQSQTPWATASVNGVKPMTKPQNLLGTQLTPPTTQDIKSHTDSLGNSQTYYPSTSAPTSKPASTSQNTSAPAQQQTAPQGGNASYGNGLLGDYYGKQLGTLGGIAGNAATTGTQNYSAANTGLINSLPRNQELADNAKSIAEKYTGLAAPYLRKATGVEIGNIGTGLAPVGQGIASSVAGAAGSYLSGLSAQEQQELAANSQGLTAQNQTQSGYGTALGGGLTGQSQGLTGVGNAASLAAPVAGAAFFGSPTSGGVVGSGNALIDTNVNQAVQLVRNGASVNDPQVTQLLSISPQAQQAFNNAMLGSEGYNPTVQSATAGQNAGLATQAQQQLFDLNNARHNLDLTSETAVNFLNTSGLLNPTVNQNAGINTYIGTFESPGQVQTYNSIIADLKRFQSQILASGNGQTPTGVTADVLSTDPSKLSVSQFVPFIKQLQQAGNQQASVLQNQYTGAGGASNGYTGAPATGTTNAYVAPTSSQLIQQGQSPTLGQQLQSGVGGAQNFIGGASGLVTGLAGKLFGAINH